MSQASRGNKKRLWRFVIAALSAFVLLYPANGVAQSAAVTLDGQRATGDGWYLARPPETDQTCNTTLSVNCTSAFTDDHLYVGWDGAQKRPEMIFAAAFEAFTLNIPEGAEITKFVLTLYQHSDSSHRGTTPGAAAAASSQGIRACAMPGFLSGQAAGRLDTAPARDCSAAVVVSNVPDAATSTTTVGWRFDITNMARTLHSDGEILGFGIEPQPANDVGTSWSLSFHSAGYSEPAPTTQDPNATIPRPGVVADIAYLPKASSSDDEDFSGLDSSFSTDFPSFSGVDDTSFESTPVEPGAEASPAPAVPVAGVFAGRTASFWQIPKPAWIAVLLGTAFLVFSGRMLQKEPSQPRPPGAASALVERSQSR